MSINFEVVEKVKQDKINEFLLYSWGKTAVNPKILGDVIHESAGEDLNFIYFESIADNCTKGMKRYHFMVWSFLYFDCHYKTGNVIDRDKGYTMQECKQWFNNYLTSLQNSLQQYL